MMPVGRKREENIVFIVYWASTNLYLDSWGVAGPQYTQDIQNAYQFETYEEAQRVIETEVTGGLYKIEKVFIVDR